MFRRFSAFCVLATMLSGSVCLAQKPSVPKSPILQASPVPLGLPVIGQVYPSGHDARSREFNLKYLSRFLTIINDNLSEGVVFSGASGFKLDPSKLFLRMQAKEDIRVYFLAEGAGYMNSMGFAFTPAGSSTPGTPYLIYPNASTHHLTRTNDAPVKPGDYVDIGKGGNGWQLDFFLVQDAYNVWKNQKVRDPKKFTWFWNDIDKNGDGIQHVVAFALPDSPYVLVGFEDLTGGGDRDYNDCLFVVDIGIENIPSLTDDPSSLPN